MIELRHVVKEKYKMADNEVHSLFCCSFLVSSITAAT